MPQTSGLRLALLALIALLVAIVMDTLMARESEPLPQPQSVTSPQSPQQTRPTFTPQQRQPRAYIRSIKSACAQPISLKIGQIDEQFNVDSETLKNALTAAANEWNAATGESLFVLRDDGEVTVNLLFDGRQDSINQLAAADREIAVLSENLRSRIRTHEAAVKQIESAAAAWNRETELHNKRVELINARSAMPAESPNDRAALEAEREEVAETVAKLQENQQRLSLERDRVRHEALLLKQEGEALNARIRSVQERFPPSVVTEGEHRRGPSVNEINIYTFYDLKEFHIVLLHELGHALGLSHTEDQPAIMHPLIEHGSGLNHLTPSDIQAALALCEK